MGVNHLCFYQVLVNLPTSCQEKDLRLFIPLPFLFLLSFIQCSVEKSMCLQHIAAIRRSQQHCSCHRQYRRSPRVLSPLLHFFLRPTNPRPLLFAFASHIFASSYQHSSGSSPTVSTTASARAPSVPSSTTLLGGMMTWSISWNLINFMSVVTGKFTTFLFFSFNVKLHKSRSILHSLNYLFSRGLQIGLGTNMLKGTLTSRKQSKI